MIRWALQHQFITIPRSGNPQHIKENADVFDFALSDADMALLNTLDEELTTGNTAVVLRDVILLLTLLLPTPVLVTRLGSDNSPLGYNQPRGCNVA